MVDFPSVLQFLQLLFYLLVVFFLHRFVGSEKERRLLPAGTLTLQ
jgi:hypothetical protein